MLTLVHSKQAPCWPWSLRHLGEEPATGATCRTCRRDVALPTARSGEVAICIYCALDSGLLEAEETPLVGEEGR